jgi:hypothetical protein
MKHLISIREILASIGEGEDEIHVWASANADQDRGSDKVTVTINCGARRAVSGELEESPAWLPDGEAVTEHLPREEVFDFTKDVFQRWVKKARAMTPLDLHVGTVSVRGVPHE